MFNIGGAEVLIIALIALVVVGPEQLPSMLRKAGQYASQLRSMSSGLRQEFMGGIDQLDPTKWDGSENESSADNAKPVVPNGYADRVAAGEPDNPFNPKPVSQDMAPATPHEAAAEAEAEAERAAASATEAANRAAELRSKAEKEPPPKVALSPDDTSTPVDAAVPRDAATPDDTPTPIETPAESDAGGDEE